jgi:cell division protein FtsA
MVYPQMAGLEYYEMTRQFERRQQNEGGYAARVGRWLKESF